MPIEYDIKQDAFYQEGVEDERKRMEQEKKNLIVKLIKSKKHTNQEIADIMDVKLSYIVELSTTL